MSRFFSLSHRLDRRWLLWHQFMQEHAHLDSWLRLVEEAASRLDSAHVTYVTAKEELGKFEVSPVSPREPDSQSRPPFCRFIPSLN